MDPNRWHLLSLRGARFPSGAQQSARPHRYDRRRGVEWYINAGFSRAAAETLAAKHVREARDAETART